MFAFFRSRRSGLRAAFFGFILVSLSTAGFAQESAAESEAACVGYGPQTQ